MKRAPQLQPLSREHHLGLVTARHAIECNDDELLVNKYWQELTDYINLQMRHHFDIEDDIMLEALKKYQHNPQVASVMEEIASQHKTLDQLSTLADKDAQPSAEQVKKLAVALYDYICYEERTLFPLAQEVLSESELDAIYDASADNVKRIDENR